MKIIRTPSASPRHVARMIRPLLHVEYRADVVDVALRDAGVGLDKRFQRHDDGAFLEIQELWPQCSVDCWGGHKNSAYHSAKDKSKSEHARDS